MKKIFQALFVFITVGILLTYLLSCLTPYISPVRFWPMTFMALGFPIIAVVFFVFIIIWLLINKRIGIVLLVLFFVGYKNLSSTLAVNALSQFHYNKDSSALRILSWNVRYFDNNERSADSPNAMRRKIFNFIKVINADVLLFQDYADYHSDLHILNAKILSDSLGYKYFFTTKDFVSNYSFGTGEAGCAIFSRLPIIDTGKIMYEAIAPESIAFADVIYRDRKVRFFTTHLISMNIKPHPGFRPGPRREKLGDAYHYTKKIGKTLRQFDQMHAKQSELIRDRVAESPYPTVVTGDFNSVPSSYVYHTIKGKNQDVFIRRGFGLGHSYYALSKTLRIDYILADNNFKVVQVTTPQLFLSDHFPVVADLKWQR